MKLRALAVLTTIVATLLLGQSASAAVTGLATTTSLPTAQVTGIVWALATSGDTVYATGRFTKARPAGVAAGGAGEVTRSNLLSFSASTGKLTSFSPTLNAEGKAITLSADGKTLFVGGLFTQVNGQPRAHLAAFSTATGALLPTYTSGPTGKVLSLVAASSGKLYVAGGFNGAGGAVHKNIAAYTASGTLDTSFKAGTNAQINALVMSPGQTVVIAGGSFSQMTGSTTVTAHGLGAFTVAGQPVSTWLTTRDDFPIQADDIVNSSRGITSLDTDGVNIYGSGFNFMGAKGFGDWEGTFAINPHTGALIWGNDCHGDTYDVWPMKGVLYSASHAHDCTAVGAYPETDPRTWHRANASTTTVDGVNVCGAAPYFCHAGMPRSTMLTSFAPAFNTGTFSGASQGPWTVSGNSSYVVFGGESTKVNGASQQGLARFAIK